MILPITAVRDYRQAADDGKYRIERPPAHAHNESNPDIGLAENFADYAHKAVEGEKFARHLPDGRAAAPEAPLHVGGEEKPLKPRLVKLRRMARGYAFNRRPQRRAVGENHRP